MPRPRRPPRWASSSARGRTRPRICPAPASGISSRAISTASGPWRRHGIGRSIASWPIRRPAPSGSRRWPPVAISARSCAALSSISADRRRCSGGRGARWTRRGACDTVQLSAMAEDESEDLSRTDEILRALGVVSTLDERVAVRELARAVGGRAARLVAAGLLGTLTFIDPDLARRAHGRRGRRRVRRLSGLRRARARRRAGAGRRRARGTRAPRVREGFDQRGRGRHRRDRGVPPLAR